MAGWLRGLRIRIGSSMKKVFQVTALLLVTCVANCQILMDYGILPPEKDSKADLYAALTALGLLTGVGDYVARMYQFNALLAGDSTNKLLVGEATRANVNAGKKKLILVHGWHPNDRDFKFVPFPSIEELKNRVLTENWSAFAATTQYANILAVKNYDVYAFDYLTSQGIDANGRRFRAKMDELFSGETGTVTIYAHSMGGLVTRFALYEGATPTYIARIITTGTPYHGSPWASPQFLSGLGPIGTLAGFVTDTVGGQDLRWDNFNSTLSGASNPKLDIINAQTSRDSLVFVMHGSVGAGSTSLAGGADVSLAPACAALTNFGTTDCIVPTSSATLSGHTLGGAPTDLGAYTHNDVKMGNDSIRNSWYALVP